MVNPSARPTPNQTAVTPASLRWIVNAAAIARIEGADTTGRRARAAFDGPGNFVIVSSASPAVPAGWRSAPTLSFGSYADLAHTLSGPALDPSIKAVLYDNEHWPLTPDAEQRAPDLYERLAAAAVHRHNLVFISAPARDLVGGLGRRPGESLDAAYLRLGLAGQAAAAGADVISIQAQRLETDAAAYTDFVKAAASQAHSRSASISVFAGLSTNPSGEAADPGRLRDDVLRSAGLVDGYWLNVPGQSPACPDCGAPRPDIAVEFLNQLAP